MTTDQLHTLTVLVTAMSPFFIAPGVAYLLAKYARPSDWRRNNK